MWCLHLSLTSCLEKFSLVCVLFVYNSVCVWEEGGKEKEVEKRTVSEQ